jgi:glycosyltransferase involved in cell wall biosynthesis
MPDDTPQIAVVVPCLNEEVTVGTVVENFLATLPGCTVYVYDNGSTDDTAKVAAKAGAVVRQATTPGKGNVVRRMFADVDADIYVLVDGDDTYEVERAPEMVGLVLDGNDLVSARRVSVDDGAYRRGHVLGNRLLTSLVQFLFARTVTDMLSGYKAMSRRFVKSFPALSTGFEIETEIAVAALEVGAPVASVDCKYRERPSGSESKLSTYKDGFRILSTVLHLLRQGRPLLFFASISVLLTVVAIILGIPIIETYAHTHKVPRFPTAILATGLVLLAGLSLTAGLILDTVTRGRREARLLHYLSIPGPLQLTPGAGQDAARRRPSPDDADDPPEPSDPADASK